MHSIQRIHFSLGFLLANTSKQDIKFDVLPFVICFLFFGLSFLFAVPLKRLLFTSFALHFYFFGLLFQFLSDRHSVTYVEIVGPETSFQAAVKVGFQIALAAGMGGALCYCLVQNPQL